MTLRRVDRLARVAGAVVLAASLASSARAAPNTAAADVQYRRGSHAYSAHRYEEALAAFIASQELEPSPNTRFKIAQCYLLLKQIASAYLNFRRAATEAEGRLKSTHEQRYQMTRTAAILEAATIESKVPRLTIAVPSDFPGGFRVLLDDVEVSPGAWGVAVETDPGTHRLVAEGPRLKRYEQAIELGIGQQLRVDIPLKRIATASLSITYATKPAGLAVTLDDKALSIDEWERRHYLDVGKHKVRAGAPGYAEFTWSRVLSDGDYRTIQVTLSPATGTPKWVFFTVGAAALAAAAIGTGYGVKAQLASNNEQAKPIVDRDPKVRDGIRADSVGSTVAFSVAGALGLTTAVLGFTTRWRIASPSEPPKRTVLSGFPILTPQQAGFLLTTNF